MVGEAIGEEKVGGIGVTMRGFLDGEMECGGPSIDTLCFIRYRKQMRKHKLKTGYKRT